MYAGTDYVERKPRFAAVYNDRYLIHKYGI